MEKENKLELRMMGLVPYNISPIQQAIQFGHAVVEYGQNMKRLGEHNQSLNKQYDDWADNWKTFIILNGGTSNHSQNRYHSEGDFTGSMEKNGADLIANEIEIATFYEPDLNDMLSAIVFIVDERVFNKEKYPDFDLKPFYGEERLKLSEIYLDPMNPKFPNKYSLIGNTHVKPEWDKWVESIGGRKNLFLRLFLKNFRLA